MTNIIDYAQGETATFAEKAFNPVDSLILSQLSYVEFKELIPDAAEEVAPARLAEIIKEENFSRLFDEVWYPESNQKLCAALAASPRFRDMQLSQYVTKLDLEKEKQFSAVTCLLDDETAYVAFRGTDANIVGWKEDFNMAFLSPIPSQEAGVAYLKHIARWFPGALIVGGHSKGGNIAVYAAAKCGAQIQERILRVFCHDSPGFRAGVFQGEEYVNIEERIHKTLPHSSLIGMLLRNREEYLVVKSGRFGIMQHDPFSWSVSGDDFSYATHVARGAAQFDRTFGAFLGAMTDERRELVVETLFQVVGTTEAVTVGDLTDSWFKSARAMIEAVKGPRPRRAGDIVWHD